MRQQAIKPLLVIVLVGSIAGPSLAAECSGINARVGDKPLVVHKGKDGTVTVFLNSTGTSTQVLPTGGTGWQNCSGIMVTKPDKSSSGSGACYRVALNGDTERITWKFTGDDRSWKRESGTGTMSGAASGTWEGAGAMGGISIGTWKGDCE